MSGTIVALVAYLAAVILIGLLAARRSGRNLGEFYLGGRAMSDVVVALSAVVSGRSAWLMMGVVGATFVLGARMAWFIPGYVIAELLMFLFAARRIRRFTERHDNVTLLDYFASRFRDGSGLLRITAAIIIVVFFTAYVGAQLKAGQVMFSLLFGWESVMAGVALMALIVGFYTIVGGYRAVSITDAVQAVLMLVGLVVLPVVAFARAGGLASAWQTLGQVSLAAAAQGGSFSMLGFGGLAGIVSGLSIGLGSPGNPHIIVRYMSIARPQGLRTAALVGTVWNVLLGWGAVYTGLAARALYDPAVLPDPSNQAFVHMATDLFPPILAGMMLAALVAAIMSTADSQILVVSSSITRDLYEKVIRRGRAVSPRAAVRLGRIWAGVVILAAALLSWATTAYGGHPVFSSVFSYVLLAWAGLGSSFGPPLLLSLYWKRATKAGAFASFISGTAACILWIALGLKAATGLHEMLIGFGLSTAVMIGVSLLTRPPADSDALIADMSARSAPAPRTRAAAEDATTRRHTLRSSDGSSSAAERSLNCLTIPLLSTLRQACRRKSRGAPSDGHAAPEFADVGQVARIEAPETATRAPRAPQTESFGDVPPENLAQFSHARIVPPRTPFDFPSGLDRVDCSVFAPPTIAPRRTIMVQVFAHLAGDAQQAAAFAREFDAAARHRAIQSLEADLAPGDRLTFQLAAPGLQIDDPVQHLVWRRVARAVQFAVTAPAEVKPGSVIAKVTVSRRSIPVGHLKFRLDVVTAEGEVQPPPRPLGDSAARYQKAFVSYASSDRAEVIKRVQMLRMMRIDFVQDVLNLSPGARWKQGLFRWIDECDLFLLFWSHAAKQSEWVQKEIDYALQRKGGDDYAPPEIQPVLIEGPPFPKPPDALKDIQFADPLLYFAQEPPAR